MTKDKAVFVMGILVTLVIICTSVWLFFQNKRLENSAERLVKTEAISTPITTQKPQEINYKETEILVLNGSGKTGLAKTYAEKLKVLGYTKVTTGNNKELVTGNLLLAPTDFGKEINLENYKYEKSDEIKIVIGKL